MRQGMYWKSQGMGFQIMQKPLPTGMEGAAWPLPGVLPSLSPSGHL